MAFDKSMRIRVLIDVRKPLLQKAKLKLRGGGEVVVDVKYGRLPLFYYYYGTIRHDTKDCDRSFITESPEKRYGEWLKVSPWKNKNEEEEGDKNKQGSSCAKKLFVVEPNDREKETTRGQVRMVTNKMQLVVAG
ncbi:Vacuolar protein sorting-associated protein 27 [Bienertia sinuspersici]